MFTTYQNVPMTISYFLTKLKSDIEASIFCLSENITHRIPINNIPANSFCLSYFSFKHILAKNSSITFIFLNHINED